MIVIGEKLNSSVKDTKTAMEQNDAAYIAALAKSQAEAGADYLDINAALFMEQEAEKLLWTLDTVRAATDAGIVLDSANFGAIGRVLGEMPLENVILNSITLQQKRFDGFLPLVKKYHTGVVALPIDDEGVPHGAAQRAEKAKQLIETLLREGVPPEKIFIDILVETAATGEGPKTALETIRMIRGEYPGIHIVCGLSNVSFGLPKRESLNSAFLSAAIACGLDAAIMDITSPVMRQTLHAAEVIAGRDEYCMNYIGFCKKEG